MGLGLSISRSIVEDHGGRLDVDRTSTSGTRFHFTLPRSAEGETGERS
jgi:two-component system sensor kinase FixL